MYKTQQKACTVAFRFLFGILTVQIIIAQENPIYREASNPLLTKEFFESTKAIGNYISTGKKRKVMYSQRLQISSMRWEGCFKRICEILNSSNRIKLQMESFMILLFI